MNQGTRWVILMPKNRTSKISCLGTFNVCSYSFNSSMGTFTETAIVVYRLPTTENSFRFRFRHGDMDMETWRHGDIKHGKRKPRRFSLIRLPFAHVQMEVCCYCCCCYVGSYPFAQAGHAHQCPLCSGDCHLPIN
jgi:hypothetical protein